MTPEELLSLKELLVKDAVDAIKLQNDAHQKQITDLVTPAVAKVDGFEARIHKLESEKLIVIKGALVYATAVGALTASLWTWIKSKIHINL